MAPSLFRTTMKVLYTIGSDEIWGYKCSVGKFNDHEIESALGDGWHESPDLVPQPKIEAVLSEEAQLNALYCERIKELEAEVAELKASPGQEVSLADLIRAATINVDKIGNLGVETLITKIEELSNGAD